MVSKLALRQCAEVMPCRSETKPRRIHRQLRRHIKITSFTRVYVSAESFAFRAELVCKVLGLRLIVEDSGVDFIIFRGVLNIISRGSWRLEGAQCLTIYRTYMSRSSHLQRCCRGLPQRSRTRPITDSFFKLFKRNRWLCGCRLFLIAERSWL